MLITRYTRYIVYNDAMNNLHSVLSKLIKLFTSGNTLVRFERATENHRGNISSRFSSGSEDFEEIFLRHP